MGGFGPENHHWGRGASQSSPTMPAGASGDQMPMLPEGGTDGQRGGGTSGRWGVGREAVSEEETKLEVLSSAGLRLARRPAVGGSGDG